MRFPSLADLLGWRGQNQPDRQAFAFLVDGDLNDAVHLTYGELDRRARQTAEALRASIEHTQGPVLLLFPPGLDVIAALFGCFYAGAIAVIPDFPRRRSSLSTLETIIEDAGVVVGLTTRLAEIDSHLARSNTLNQLRWLSLDEIASTPVPTHSEPPVIQPDSVALLQYTSGSTGRPKGVMVSHANIMHNSAGIQRRFQQTENSRSLYWVPPSHDMGLVGGVFQSLFVGYPATFMPPLAFMQSPVRWLQAISVLHVTTSAAPNFAYELCVRKIAPAQRDSLDLSSWTVAINGAEPVQANTIEKFSQFFAPCGFRREAFCPSYGLAETTLVVSGESRSAPPTIIRLPANQATPEFFGRGRLR